MAHDGASDDDCSMKAKKANAMAAALWTGVYWITIFSTLWM
jgi:hypothetical protein